MRYVLVNYRINAGREAVVERAVRDFVAAIGANEPRTLRYESFRHSDDPLEFTHLMVFASPEAEKEHESTGYLKTFVEALYPACERPPRFTELGLVGQATQASG